MKKSNKIWFGIGACVTLGAVATAASDQPTPVKATFVGNLDRALENIFAGEGGEGGAGLTPMWPSVVAPALTGPEIEKVVKGNSLQLQGHIGYHFTTRNTVEGNYTHWDQLPKASDCPVPNKDDSDFYLNPKDNVCWKRKVLPLQGSWQVKNHQLCLDVSWTGGKKQDCRYVTILLDDIALFDADGNIDGKGHKLFKGKQLEK
jgi:hypothetical protein